ncbi:MAG: hypothetical protein ABIO24_05350 [Saprospiraceae bacterium]
MKKYLFFLLPALTLALLTTLASCEKDEGKLPNIDFKTGATYTSSDITVAKNEPVLIGIQASKAEDKDVLKSLNESVSFDGAAATSLESTTLSGTDGDNFSKDYLIVTRNQAGTEKYTFTVTNRDGLTNSVSVTLTVQ